MQDTILNQLNKGPQSTSYLAKALKVTPKTVRKHLKRMAEAGLVVPATDGTWDLSKPGKSKPADAGVDALIEQTAGEVNTALAKPRTKAGKEKAPRIMGCRVGTKNAVGAQMLLDKGTLEQKDLSGVVGHSSDFITWLVKKGYAEFDKKTRVVTITAAGRQAK